MLPKGDSSIVATHHNQPLLVVLCILRTPYADQTVDLLTTVPTRAFPVPAATVHAAPGSRGAHRGSAAET